MSNLATGPCHACKSKRTKCDKLLPACHRCLRVGKDCPGYPDSRNMVFRDMTQFAERKVKSRTPRAEKPPQGQSSPNLALALRQPSTIQHHLATDWREVAIPRFFNDYVMDSDVVMCGSFQFLPEVLKVESSCKHLLDAIQAVALVSLANQLSLDHLYPESSYAYGNAISGLAKTLSNPNQRKSDAVFSTTFLLGFFEMLLPAGEPGVKFWNSVHNRGQVSLLQLRGTRHLRTTAEKYLFAANYTQHMVACIATHVRPPEEADKWLDLLQARDSGREIGHINLRTSRLLAAIQQLFDDPIQDEEWVLQMLQCIRQGLLIDAEYQTWEDTRTSGVWAQKEVRSKQNKEIKFPAYVYHDVFIAFAWNTYRSSRLHMNVVLRRCIHLIQAHPSSQSHLLDSVLDYAEIYQETTTVIEEMRHGICANVPYCLGDIDELGNEGGKRKPFAGRLVLWPIHAARCSCEEGSETELWLRRKLEFISEVMGNKLAGRIAMRNRTEPWDLR